MRVLFSRPSIRTASRSLSTPMASVSAVYSGTSKDTLTWLCAARLYISSGFTMLIMRISDEESVMSP